MNLRFIAVPIGHNQKRLGYRIECPAKYISIARQTVIRCYGDFTGLESKNYNWVRLWCPGDKELTFEDGGYIFDLSIEYAVYNRYLVPLEDIVDVDCLLLVGEPGVGKSREMHKLRRLTEQRVINANGAVLSLNLNTYDSSSEIRQAIIENPDYLAWRASSNNLYLLLDSLDEGILSVPILANTLLSIFEQ